MQKVLFGVAAVFALASCGGPNTPEQVTAREPVVTSTAATTTAKVASSVRKAGAAIQVSMYMRELNAAFAAHNTKPADQATALTLAAKICESLDIGMDPFSVSQALASTDMFTIDEASRIVPKAMGAACTEHL